MKEREIVLSVTGMTCMSCAKHVDRALRAVEGVTGVEVRVRDKQAVVHHDLDTVPTHALIEALREAGYDGRLAA